MFKKKRKALFTVILLIVVLVAAPRVIVVLTTRSSVYTVETVAQDRAAIVFGAGLRYDGSPTPVLKDRVAAAVELYRAGKVEKILMSGDNRFVDYNEPGAMRGYALELGLPEQAVVLDYAGRRTYDTCYRAKHIFGLDSAILVTQRFHLSRALYTCRALGLDVVGVPADRGVYRDAGFWNVREIFASLAAFIQVHLTHPEPVLGEQEPIFPVE